MGIVDSLSLSLLAERQFASLDDLLVVDKALIDPDRHLSIGGRHVSPRQLIAPIDK
jgi:hypothetical protein